MITLLKGKATLKLSKKDYYYADFEPMVEYMQEDNRSDTWASAFYYQCSWFGLRIVLKSKRIKEELNAVKSDYRFANNKTLFEVKDYLVKYNPLKAQ